MITQKAPKNSTPENDGDAPAEAMARARGELPDIERQLAEKIEMLAEYAGGRKVAAKAMGVSVTTLDNYRSGATQPRFLELLKLAAAANHNVEYLLAGTGFWTLLSPQNDEEERSDLPATQLSERMIQMPRYDVRASAGAGALVVSEDVSEYFSVGRNWLSRNLPPWAPPNAVVGVLEGAGDSMEPTIRDGDLVMVVQNVDWRVVERGGIFVFSLDHDRLLLKRLQVLNNGDLRIISDNKAYEPDLVPFGDIEHRVRVHGQVFFAGGKPRSY
ncbi:MULTISPECIES: S24 family peptidase [Phyllobacteriaceae]|nr:MULTISPECIES: S24 family peptidase [Mesorhizobium]MBN9232732.1 helix-turn-helix transcriptional regulator [Mesorhizobium sp.]MDQ0330331.1 phage repressor protein C with HTH and peptisase S24 domain [Mesorhizobium sp. YL-MeA3-2017]